MATERISIPIDRFGRVVLPKTLRDRLGLQAGAEFDVEELDNAIILRPVIKTPKIIEEKGWMILQTEGAPITAEDVQNAVEGTRRERDGKW